jgi:hypothetical protein
MVLPSSRGRLVVKSGLGPHPALALSLVLIRPGVTSLPVASRVSSEAPAADRADVDDLVPLDDDDAVLQMALAAILVGDDAGRRDDPSRHAAVPSRLNCRAPSQRRFGARPCSIGPRRGLNPVTARRSAALGEGGVDQVGF